MLLPCAKARHQRSVSQEGIRDCAQDGTVASDLVRMTPQFESIRRFRTRLPVLPSKPAHLCLRSRCPG